MVVAVNPADVAGNNFYSFYRTYSRYFYSFSFITDQAILLRSSQ